MEYPDEQQNTGILVEEIPVGEEEILEGFATLDVQNKINAMLGEPMQREGKIDNNPLFEHGDRVINDLPTINVEEKIRRMLDF